jgi:hypothetical protein
MSAIQQSGAASLLKGVARALLPRLYERLQSRYARPHRLARRIGRRVAWRVHRGPFAGMQYGWDPRIAFLTTRLLGTYEEELHPWFASLAGEPFDLVVNVGCAEGYYAVGAARMFSRARVIAFDLDAEAQELCRNLAEMNGVGDRVEVRGYCSVEDLAHLPLGRALLIVDCEGGEVPLLDPLAVPALATCTIMVELHDWVVPTVKADLQSRFAGTHCHESVEARPRDPRQYPVLSGICLEDQLWATKEDRRYGETPVQQSWLLFVPRSRGAQADARSAVIGSC